jgi:hypothetical protein
MKNIFPLFVVSVMLFSCGNAPALFHDDYIKYLVTHNSPDQFSDTIYYSLVKDPKGVPDDTIWHARSRDLLYEADSNGIKQSVDVRIVMDHLGNELITATFEMDSAGQHKYQEYTTLFDFAFDSAFERFTDESGMSIEVTSQIMVLQNGSTGLVVDFAPKRKFVVFRMLPEGLHLRVTRGVPGLNLPSGIILNKEMKLVKDEFNPHKY